MQLKLIWEDVSVTQFAVIPPFSLDVIFRFIYFYFIPWNLWKYVTTWNSFSVPWLLPSVDTPKDFSFKS